MEQLLNAAETFVQRALSGNDASHDIWHIRRVYSIAKRLAEEELLAPDRVQLVELCALLHDVDDWKYTPAPSSYDAGPHAAPPVSRQGNRVEAFLESQGCNEAQIIEITTIISSIGFKEQLPSASSSTQDHAAKPRMSLEAQVLQDADRLDAIGAVGIARCFTFGGAFKRVLHDPTIPPRVGLTKEEYMNGAGKEHNTTINHFYEKLLLLKDLMNTAAGRRLAERRHDFMQEYLQQFVLEWEGQA